VAQLDHRGRGVVAAAVGVGVGGVGKHT